VDPILVNISYWKWAERSDKMPEGLLEAASSDLQLVYDALDKELAQRQFVSGPLSVADIALFPHLASVKALEVEFSTQEHPNLGRWFKQMRALPICAADLKRAWTFGFPGASCALAQPTAMGGRIFIGSQSGKVYSLDASTGCTYWELGPMLYLIVPLAVLIGVIWGLVVSRSFRVVVLILVALGAVFFGK
jgi:hypothetical protein